MAVGRKRGSSTGKVHNVQADQTNWRVKLMQSRIKFDDPQKKIYLAALRKHGRKGLACEAAGVSIRTVLDHRDNDPDFDEAVSAALDTYSDFIAGHVKDAGTVGDLKPIFHQGVRVVEPILNEDGVPLLDAKGNPRYQYAEVYEKSYRMLELEAKRVDPTYRERSTIGVEGLGGGVLLAPAGITPEQAVKEADEANKKADEVHAKRVAAVEGEAKK